MESGNFRLLISCPPDSLFCSEVRGRLALVGYCLLQSPRLPSNITSSEFLDVRKENGGVGVDRPSGLLQDLPLSPHTLGTARSCMCSNLILTLWEEFPAILAGI